MSDMAMLSQVIELIARQDFQNAVMLDTLAATHPVRIDTAGPPRPIVSPVAPFRSSRNWWTER